MPQVPILGPGNLNRWIRIAGLVLILLSAAVAVAPQLIRGNSCGHDFDVHLVSWLDCVNAWKHGLFYPHWTPSPNYDAGEPRFVFYPPLTWMLGAALGLVFPWSVVPIALTFLCLAGAGLATRALALEACDEPVATLAGCASIFSGFALFTAYERSAFPEFAGGFWLPLLLLFALRDRHPTGSLIRRVFDGSTAPLALVLAGAWLSNLPLAVMATYLLAGVALLAAIASRSWVTILRATIATPLGLGLAAIYWVPAALERNWVDIKQATQDPGYNFESNWLFAHNANPILALHDAINRQASWIAVSMIAVAVISLAVGWRRGALPNQKSSGSPRWWLPLAAIPAVVLFFSFPVSRPLWHLLPEMRFLQYPWRWLEAVEAPMAIFFAAAIWPAARRARIAVVAVCAAWFVAATVYAGAVFFQVCYPEDTVASTLADYSHHAGFEGMYEYEPPGADISQIPTGLPDACLVSDPSVQLGKPDPDDPDANPTWNQNQGGCDAMYAAAGDGQANPEHRQLRAVIPHAGYLVLRLLSYPSWKVRVNGQLLNPDRFNALRKRDDGLMAVPVPHGDVSLTVDWATTPDVVAGRWVSGACTLLLLGSIAFERRRSGRRQPPSADRRLS
ncbi:MAG: 6-pyruvoyl-tetrahydropterin synthase-related protein [Terracidiphilus sp.]